MATALATVVGLVFAGAGLLHAGPADTDAYWNAASRLAEGQALYPPTDPNADDVYRYAPWFAWMWVPLLAVPKDIAYLVWTLILSACAAATVMPLLHRGWSGIALAALVLGVLLYAAGYGNPTPAITAMLTASKIHPVTVGVAGSLKVYPLLLTAGMIAERRWRDVAIAWAVAAALWAPALLYGLGNYVVSPGHGGISLWSLSPLAWLTLAVPVSCVALVLTARGSPWSLLSAATLIAAAVPRVWPSDLAYIALAATHGHPFRPRSARSAAERIRSTVDDDRHP